MKETLKEQFLMPIKWHSGIKVSLSQIIGGTNTNETAVTPTHVNRAHKSCLQAPDSSFFLNSFCPKLQILYHFYHKTNNNDYESIDCNNKNHINEKNLCSKLELHLLLLSHYCQLL
jgi:hypothetical protein